MIRMSVLYPATDGARFDMDYYLTKHMPMVKERFGPFGLVSAQADKGVGGGAPGAPAPYVAIASLTFASAADMQKALGTHGAEVVGDVPNYTDIKPVMQVSEVAFGA